jgi:hypothetical protein
LLVAARERQGLGRLDRLLGAVGIEIDVHHILGKLLAAI